MSFKVQKLNEGTGPTVPPGNMVKVHYTGKLRDGTVFDSSIPRGEPLEFVVGAGYVIRGWDEGICQLQKGQKAIITCPPEYAYGSQGAGGVIPPNATLTFEVEVIDFYKPQSATLKFLYGEDYETNLGSGCINFTNENENNSSKFYQRILGISLPLLNLAMALALFPPRGLIAYFTNWCMIASILTVGGIMYCGSLPDVHKHKGTLACLHLIFEFSFMCNLVVVIVYWSVLHA